MLTHPLFLLLISALLTGLLIPLFTRQSQERKQALDLKTSIVAEMSESVTGFLTRIGGVRVLQSWLPKAEAAAEDPNGAERLRTKFDAAADEMNEAFFSFERTSAGITTKLRVFFPSTDVWKRWRELADLVSRVYAMEGTYGAERRARSQRDIRERLLAQEPALDIAEDWGEANEKWQAVQIALIDIQSDLISDILREPVSPPRTQRRKLRGR